MLTSTNLKFSALIVCFAVSCCGFVARADEKAPSTTNKAADAKPTLPKCPVMGEAIDVSVSIPSNDGPVFFCCKECIEKYQADPAKFTDAVAAQHKAMADKPKVQVRCPVMSSKAADPKFSSEVEGKKVSFCCNGCPTRYRKDPAQYAFALANAYTYQTKCPVTGSEVVGRNSAKLVSGQTIYFATPEAKKSFLESPDKYMGALAEQGVKLDPANAKEEKKE